MATEDKKAGVLDHISGVGLRVGVVTARWNSEIVKRLNQGATA